MKRLPAVISLCFLLIISVGSLTSYAGDDEPSLTDDGTAFFKTSPALSINNITSDLFTGRLNYPVPIIVPAGRKGMEPKLTLNYRSTTQNGWLGAGWELEIGDIERSTKHGVDFSGEEYVLRVAGAGLELVNTAVTSEYREYHAKVEDQFLRIRQYNAGTAQAYWVVTDKSGTSYSYSQYADTRQNDPADSTHIFKWCLDYVVDANGNYMQFSYFKDQGQIYLDHIDYTGNSSMTPRNTVTFVRDDGTRADAPVMYTAGFGVKTAYRLDHIDVKGNDNLVRSYKIRYTTSVVSLTLLYIWPPLSKSVPRVQSIRTPADFGCDCQYSS